MWLRVDRVFGESGIPRDHAAGRRQYERRLEQRRREGEAEEWKGLRRGWYLGEEEFRQDLLARARGVVGDQHYGLERRETEEARAERLVREELWRRNWSEAALGERRKGHPEKVRIARRIRQEITVSLKWIA